MDTKQTVAEALAIVNPCLGEVFTGYKGGEFGMTKATPVWIAHYGCCGKKIMEIDDNGSIILKEDD
jgi:hypothetical protein